MPLLNSTFVPPFWLRNGHAQTILPVLLPRRVPLRFRRERLELPDGDFVDLDWADAGKSNHLAIITHGLEGGTDAKYIRGMAAALNAVGWGALAWSFRGCSGEPNRLARFYHSGDTGDLGAVIAHAAAGYASIALVGFSLGGNVILKYLGEGKVHASVVGGAAICAPVDLASSARKLDSLPKNRVYLQRFLASLVNKVEAKAARYPQEFDLRGIRAIRSFQEFDDRYTAPLHGFRDAADYWSQASSKPYLTSIKAPALLVNSRNDPFLAPECYPWIEAKENPNFFLETPESGGHVGFLDLKNGLQPWSERRVVGFFREKVEDYANSS